MGDDWDDDDWESSAANFKPVAAAAKPVTAHDTKVPAALASLTEPDLSKFADEDKEEAPVAVEHTIKPQVLSVTCSQHLN